MKSVVIFLESFYRQVRAYFIYKGPVLEVFYTAIALHGEQTRKYNGRPYWFHLDDVALTLFQVGVRDVNILSAALLHDALEDVEGLRVEKLQVILALIKSDHKNTVFNPEVIVRLVEELTDEYVKINYPFLNRRERKRLEVERFRTTSREAKLIKLSDLASNTPSIKRHDPEFFAIYGAEANELLLALKGIHTGLFQQVRKAIG